MSSLSYEVPYNAVVRKQTAAQLKKKIASQPQLEHFEIPSVFRSMQRTPFKDRKYILSDMSSAQTGGSMCHSCSGGRDTSSGGRDTSSGGRDTSSGGRKMGGKMGGKMIGLAKPRNIKGDGFFDDLKRDLTHPKATLKGLTKGKTYVEALKKTGQILEGALPYGAAAMAGLETGSPAAAIGAFKGTKSQIKEVKDLAGSGMDKRKMRGQLVAKLMKQHGVSLVEASRMIKEKKMM